VKGVFEDLADSPCQQEGVQPIATFDFPDQEPGQRVGVVEKVRQPQRRSGVTWRAGAANGAEVPGADQGPNRKSER
jgi:hypothetical protein